MAELVTGGFIGGRLATLGWYPGLTARAIDYLISALEADNGATPIFRVRLDLDGDGVYEIIEQEFAQSIDSITKKTDAAFGVMGPSSMKAVIFNQDRRCSEFYSGSYVYNKKWAMSPAIIEMNFDGIHRDDEDYWLPLFIGFLNGKEEREDGCVSLSFIDYWGKVFDFPLYKDVPADTVIPYSEGVADARVVGVGLYFGNAEMCYDSQHEKDKNLMLPMVANTAGTAMGSEATVAKVYPKYALLVPQMLNKNLTGIASQNFGAAGDVRRVWLWLWNDAIPAKIPDEGETPDPATGNWDWSPDVVAWDPDKKEWKPGTLGGIKKQYGYVMDFKITDEGNIHLISSFGKTWTKTYTGTADNQLHAVAFGNGKFIAAGWAGLAKVSSDGGKTWADLDLGTAYEMFAIVYGGGMWVVAGTEGRILSSPDGSTWTHRAGLTSYNFQALVFGNGKFVSLSAGVGETQAFHYSSNGIDWAPADSYPFGFQPRGGCFGNGLFVAVGDSGAICTSTDGISWTEQSTGASANFKAVCYGSGKYVAVGGDGAVFTSPNGADWTEQESDFSGYLYAVIYAGENFVACGDNKKIITSPNGIQWTSVSIGDDGALTGLAAIETTLVLAGYGDLWISKRTIEVFGTPQYFDSGEDAKLLDLSIIDYFEKAGYVGLDIYDSVDPAARLSVSINHRTGTDNYWRNPVRCLYHIMTEMAGLPAGWFDRSTDWSGALTWDFASWIMESRFTTIRIKDAKTLKDFAQAMCGLCGGKIFNGWGVNPAGTPNTRNIKITLLTPPLPNDPAIKDIYGEDISSPSMVSDQTTIYNRVVCNGYQPAEGNGPEDPACLPTWDQKDQASIDKYGEKILDISRHPLQDIIFWTDIVNYYDFGINYLAFFKDPAQLVSFDMNLKAILHDIGRVVRLTEGRILNLDPADALYSGYQELVSMALGTSDFRVKIQSRCVGYRMLS
jgi:photosystem II stability/assembly factor-like uncharacterized protein